MGRMLQILREFATDPILITYVIDDVWDDMKAMKVCLQIAYIVCFVCEFSWTGRLSLTMEQPRF